MFAVNDFDIFTPIWRLPKRLYVQQNNTWVEMKQLHTTTAGSWKKVWSRNYFPDISQNHDFLETSIDGAFTAENNTISFTTFWSTNNNQPWAISAGAARIFLNAETLDAIEVTKKLYLDTTNGSSIATLKPNQYAEATSSTQLTPLNEENSSGVSNVKWEVYESPANMFNTTPALISSFPANTSQIQFDRNCLITGTDQVFRVKRTYYRYRGYSRLQPQIPLYVFPGQNYSIITNATAVSHPSLLAFSLGAVTGETETTTDYFGTNSKGWNSGDYPLGETGQKTFSLTIPGVGAGDPWNHFWIRPEIRIISSIKPSQKITPTPTRYYQFDYLNLFRNS